MARNLRQGVRILAQATAFVLIASGIAGCAKLAELGGGGEGAASVPSTTDAKSDPRIEIAPKTLDFGELSCGTESAAKLITIQNTGGLPLPYKAQLPAGTSFRLEGELEGTLAPKASVSLSVFVSPRAAGENAADLAIAAGQKVESVHATAKGSGPTLELVQSTIAFGDVRKENGGSPVEIEVRNSGSETLSVSSFTSTNPAFDVRWAAKPAAFTVAPKASSTFNVALVGASADDSAALEATITPVTTKLCGAAQILAVSGRRVTSQVTINPADWGKEDCNTTPKARSVTITNYANAEVRYTLALPTNSAFVIVTPGPGVVAPAPSPDKPQTTILEIAPKRLGTTAPLPDVREVLGVTLDSSAPGVSGRRDVPLHVETRGAVVTLTPVALSFSSDGATSDTRSFTVTNAGNEPLGLSWSLTATSGSGSSAWTYSAPGSVSPGASLVGSVTFRTSDIGLSTGTLTASQSLFSLLTGVASCQPLSPINLSGNNP